jgi:hypothetical protein
MGDSDSYPQYRINWGIGISAEGSLARHHVFVLLGSNETWRFTEWSRPKPSDIDGKPEG